MNDGEKKVLFSTASAQLRYLERMEHKYFMRFMASGKSNYAAAEAAYDGVRAALDNFDPDAHDKLVRARNEAR